ncbi:cell wall hydrolase [Cytobacillus sp. FJAT-54145]|uniref:Cell wall hydrolase n=1 Tax=Cytobacillus spartinae TaxID=3299023 RepID=A0ABW6K5V8_9BACI
MKKLISLVTFFVLILSANTSTLAASSHTVTKGETYWKIALKHGVPYKQIMRANNTTSGSLWVGQRITIPASSVSAAEKDLLARLVEAEAKGEPYAGKVAVATVVLNRVDSNIFPNTVRGVIYEAQQFTPVSNGQINKPASLESKRAVNEALAFRGLGKGSLYFFNPAKTSNKWLRSKPVTVVIGNHVFAK